MQSKYFFLIIIKLVFNFNFKFTNLKNIQCCQENFLKCKQIVLQSFIQKKYKIFTMACSKYEYVKKFEQTKSALLESYIVVRVDGRAFTNFCQAHSFQKPNDLRAILIMNASAQFVCQTFKDIFLAYGQSDEYSFVLKKQTTLFSRRTDKILSCIVSAFSSAYIFNWSKYFDFALKQIPTFDSRVVVYPNQKCLKDYFRWRQVDCHINNLYNTVFWALVKSGKSNQQVQNFLKDTNSGQKNQILFNDFKINYNKIDQVYRRGTFILYKYQDFTQQTKQQMTEKQQTQVKIVQIQQRLSQIKVSKELLIEKKEGIKKKKKLCQTHEDCIKEEFWQSILQK